ncbi:MAG: hypothetical protein ACO3N7_05090, partial [Kiritimatiellia bacterium]
MATFSYFPAASAIYHSAFRWNGNYIKIFVGASNFQKSLGTPFYWILTLLLTMSMIYLSQKTGIWSKGTKWICGFGFPLVNVAVLLREHPFTGLTPAETLIPGFIWLALWLFFRWRLDPDSEYRGILNFSVLLLASFSLLRALGMYEVLAFSFSGLLSGLGIWVRPSRSEKIPMLDGMRIFHALAGVGLMVWSLALHAGGEVALWSGFGVIAVLVLANLMKMLPSIITAVVIHRLKSETANYWYRVLFVIPMIIP